LRRSPRIPPIALLLAVLALTAGCGAGEISPDEVPGPPPALTVTSDTELGAADDAATATDETAADADTAEEPAAADADAAAPAEDAVVPEATAAPEEAPVTEEPAPGSPPEQFEDFCEQNAGAC
jgi:hypothetical protein